MSGDSELHVRICKEKAAAAKDELERGRDSVVGDLAVKAVEQAVEAAASLEDLHFHTEPRRAHAERTKWAKRKIPGISSDLDAVFAATGPMNLNIHAIPETLEEFSKANPVFLRELERDGRVLYSREPFGTRVSSPLARPFSIVSYDLSSLSYREKMRVLYRLYRAGRGGLVEGSGGVKLGGGCVLVPRDAGQKI